ncbi:thioredoxin-like protein [Aulographum hederae CBS 113979]|uniref:thioredoxin-dependent peroxiredoxin n=1 Tax=Aulographum hederae CBS 113979 TaxID=1176131 RepID=A0A6G1GS66_9PEZI|nr:thioredoxin-like protein [Aulographum hederae CBS 113979]
MAAPPQTARVQHPAPYFSCQAVVDGGFEELTLPALTTEPKKWLVLIFIPMAWTFVCPTEIIAFSNAASLFASRNATLAIASTDSEYSLLAWNNASRKDGGLGGVAVPLLSDKNMKLARDYGVLLEEKGIALRGSFIIDPEGVVRQITINDLPVGRSVDETIRLLDAFQFVEKYGEVCPVNWTAGEKGIKATEEGNKKYLEKVYGDVEMAGEAGVAQNGIGVKAVVNGNKKRALEE